MNTSQNKNEQFEFTDMEKLFYILGYITLNVNEGILPSDKIELKNTISTFKYDKSDADLIYKYISDIYQKVGCPKVVSDKDYKKLQRLELYRSADSYDHLASTLTDFNTHYGWGFAANGLYFDTNKLRASKYHLPISKYNDQTAKQESFNKVLTAKLNSNKILNATYLKTEFLNSLNGKLTANELIRDRMITLTAFLSSIHYDKIFDEELFVHMLLTDPAKLAIILGLDAIKVKETYSPISIVVVNRSKLAVSKSEYTRICDNSTKYKEFSEIIQSQPN